MLVWAGAGDARRVALVVGNDQYHSVAPLQNARRDARSVAIALEQVGFAVVRYEDLNLERMKGALRAFKKQIAGGDEVVFYFSGHGVQIDGANYLIPIDLTPESEDQVADDSVPLRRILEDLRDQKTRFTLAIIDACRNNPFKSGSRAIGGRGLAPVSAATGQMILFSAGAGQEALDRLGPGDSDPNGVFTRVLIKELSKPGVAVYQMAKEVQSQVISLARQANHDQVPALYDQSVGDFYFVPKVATAARVQSLEPLHVQTADELEQEYWNRIKDSRDPTDFADYAAAFPHGAHGAEAALLYRKLKQMKAQRTPPTRVATAARSPAQSAEAVREKPASQQPASDAAAPPGKSAEAAARVDEQSQQRAVRPSVNESHMLSCHFDSSNQYVCIGPVSEHSASASGAQMSSNVNDSHMLRCYFDARNQYVCVKP